MVMKNDGHGTWKHDWIEDGTFFGVTFAIGEHRSVTTTYVLSESEIKTGYIYILSQWTIR